MSSVIVDFETYPLSVPAALEKIGLKKRLTDGKPVLLKPNLVNASPPPVTTPAACCEAVLAHIRSFSQVEIIIAEGTGDASLSTYDVFDRLGYTKLLDRYENVSLMDLNTEPLQKLENKDFPVFPSIYLPAVAFTHTIVSIPVLKVHSLAMITGTLKNMMGFAPPEYYGGGYGWNKSAFHNRMQQSLIDLIRYRKPDVTLMDATIGLRDYHLGGRKCNPPVGKIVAGFDPVDVDRKAAALLGLDWKKIAHLCVAV